MKAIIPVAGMGTRLRPHTYTQPKALMHVAGRPMLAHILDELIAVGLDEIVLVVGYLGEMIEAYVSTRYPSLRLHFVAQGEALGNGHAVYVAREHLDGQPILIIFGDTIIKGDLAGLVHSAHSVAGVKEVDDPRRLGVVELDARGFVRRFVEKPTAPSSNLALTGAFLLKDSAALGRALERLVRGDRGVRGEFWLADGLQLMVDAGERMGTFPIEHWYDCGTVDALLQANRELLDALTLPAATTRGAIVLAPSFVDPAATVERSVVGPYASIAEGARVVNSVIRDSIVNSGASVEDALLEHSMVGERAIVKGRLARVNTGDSSEIELG